MDRRRPRALQQSKLDGDHRPGWDELEHARQKERALSPDARTLRYWRTGMGYDPQDAIRGKRRRSVDIAEEYRFGAQPTPCRDDPSGKRLCCSDLIASYP